MDSASRTLVLPQFHPIQLKLDRSNYAFWRAIVHSAIRAHGFDDFISSTANSPSPLLPSGSGGDMVPNPEFVNWIRRDQYLLSWMLSSVGEMMLGHVVRCKTSREIWTTLETVFHSQSKAQVAKFRVQLQSTRKGTMSVEDYFMKMRGIADQLAAIGKPLDDDELIMHIMAGFGPEYESLVVNTMQRIDSPSLQEIQLAFQAYEVRIAQQQSALFDNSAHIAYRRGQPIGSGGGRGSNNAVQFGRGGARPNFGRVLMCQLCGRTGHVALKCFKRFDIHFTGNESGPSGFSGSQTISSQTPSPKAFVTDFVGVADSSSGAFTDGEGNWFVDSGATTHITRDLSNLAVSNEYTGAENLMVGNGQVQSPDLVEGESS